MNFFIILIMIIIIISVKCKIVNCIFYNARLTKNSIDCLSGLHFIESMIFFVFILYRHLSDTFLLYKSTVLVFIKLCDTREEYGLFYICELYV